MIDAETIVGTGKASSKRLGRRMFRKHRQALISFFQQALSAAKTMLVGSH
jgi:hypothetical protein